MLFTKPLCFALSLLSFPLFTRADGDTDKAIKALKAASNAAQSATTVAKSIQLINGFTTYPKLMQAHQAIDSALHGIYSSNQKRSIVISIEFGGPSARLEQHKLLSPSDGDQKSLADTYVEYTKVVTQLAQVEIGKSDIAKHTLSDQPMAAAIRSTQNTGEAAAYAVMQLAQKYEEQIYNAMLALDEVWTRDYKAHHDVETVELVA